MKKKLWLILCFTICIIALTACGSSGKKSGKAGLSYDKAALTKTTNEYLISWNEQDFLQFVTQAAGQVDDSIIKTYESWDQLKKQLGTFVKVKDTTVTESTDSVSVRLYTEYEKGNIDFKLIFDDSSNIKDIVVEKRASLVEKMEKAGINTILGMGTVFLALIFISFVIGLLKYVPMFLEKQKRKEIEKETAVVGVDKVIADIAVQEEEELANDTELVAVVTAAIMASMGEEAPADGLFVRSIHRRRA